MILLSELSRRRIRSIQKLIRVGRNEVVVVLRVDKEKGASSHPDRADLILVLTDARLKATSTFQNVVSRPKTSRNARSAT